MRWLTVLFLFFHISAIGQHFVDIASAQNINVVQYAPQHYANGMSFYDFDEDGWDDLTYPMNNDSIAFYRNVNGTFMPIGSYVYAPGDVRQICWVDYDDDGDLDICISFDDIGIRLFANDGNFNMTDVTATANLSTLPFTGYGFAFADVDTDGDLDLYVSIYESTASTTSPVPNQFYENQGNGTFMEVAAAWGIDNGTQTSFQPVWFDFDNDFDLDLHVINDRPAHEDVFYVNNGSNTFVNQTSSLGILNSWQSPMSLNVADFDNDGYQDVFKTDIATGVPYNGVYDYFKLFRNQGGSFFQNIAGPFGLESVNFGWGALWVDYNNDCYEDLYIATGDIDSLLPVKTSLLYENTSGIGFANKTDSVLANITNVAYCPVKGDIDNDGFYDIVVVNHGIPPSVLQNSGNKNHYIKVTPVGLQSNKQAIGTLIKVYSGGICQTQTVFCGSGLCAQNSQHKIFGTGQSELVDSLVAYFPSGIVTKMYSLAADQHYYVEEKVTVEIDLIPGASSTTLCQGDSITIGVPGLYNYSWSNGQTTSTITVTNSGVYSFQAENSFGDTVYISQAEHIQFEPPLSAVTVVNQPPCGNDSSGTIQIFPTQPQLVNSILWSNGDIGTLADSLSPGYYTYTILSNNGCTTSDSAEIVATPDFSVSAFTTPVTDTGLGSVTFSLWGGTAPFQFFMDTTTVAQTINNLTAGNYEVTVIDALGCEVIVSFVIIDQSSASIAAIENNVIRVSYQNGTCSVCADQALSGATISIVDITGKTVYEWQWRGANPCSSETMNLVPGYYQVSISHATGKKVQTLLIR